MNKLNKGVLVALLQVAVTVAPAFADHQSGSPGQADVGKGTKTIAETILAILAFGALPIAALYGLIRGGLAIINGQEIGKGVLAIVASIIIGLGPLLMNTLFGIDLAQFGAAFKITGG